jgi:glycosyltransferase involved in cell wall biosynthesis
MNILIVTQYFWPENFPINSLTSGLIEKGHKITVLTGIPNYPSGRFFMGYGIFRNLRQNYKGARVIRVPLVPRGKGGVMSLILNYLSFAFFASVLAPFVCRGRYDVIFVYEPSPITVGLPAVVLKKIKSARILFWVQDLWPESLAATGVVNFSPVLAVIKLMVRFIYHECSLILVQSRAFIPFIQSFGIARERILYFPNSAEDFYCPIELSEDSVDRKLLPPGFIVMFAGNIGVSQDFPTIISAAERLKGHSDIHWVIIGGGRMRQWAEDEIAVRNLRRNFIFLGMHPPEMMPRYFSLADVLLVSLKDEEIFKHTIPSKIQSYLACAKPVIAALNGEAAKIIDESGGGISCSAENAQALADAVLRLYRMTHAERRVMGLNGRRYFERNFEKTKLLNEFNQMLIA